MKAVQIDRYAKEIRTRLRDIPKPEAGPTEVLVKVKAAAVNPLELLILTGSVRLIQDYPMPLTLGNECSGVVEAVGAQVTDFRVGDRVYCRLPLAGIGAFAEYVAVDHTALSPMPAGYDFATAAAIPLTGLTAWQGITEELEARPGQTLLIPGGSGSFGQMAVPLAKALGLRVIVTGNDRAREAILAAGADEYLDYRKENYWEILSGVDCVIDTLGAGEFARELSVLKPGGPAAEPADRPQQGLCGAQPVRLCQACPVHRRRCPVRPGRPEAGQILPVYFRACRRRPAAAGHPHRGAAAHCSPRRPPSLYPGNRRGSPGPGAERSHCRQGDASSVSRPDPRKFHKKQKSPP